MAASERTVLVVEDELPILRFLRSALQENGFRVIEATDGRSALESAAARKPDMVLLDLMLPDMDGIDVLKRLRQWTAAPVIILSARGQENDKIAGLDAGADDYLTKPFGVEELLARMRVAFRHAEQRPEDQPPVYEHEGLKVDLAARRVWVRKKEVRLSPLQYELLAVLVRNAGRVVVQKQLIREVWHEAGDASPESVRICVHQLRHRIEGDPVRPRHIKTEPGVGYRLEAPSD
ncbi:MAG: response regulator [Elusimicrobia bacterium]|nr:response regulator [Elusimicrobiota bacterium]